MLAFVYVVHSNIIQIMPHHILVFPYCFAVVLIFYTPVSIPPPGRSLHAAPSYYFELILFLCRYAVVILNFLLTIPLSFASLLSLYDVCFLVSICSERGRFFFHKPMHFYSIPPVQDSIALFSGVV